MQAPFTLDFSYCDSISWQGEGVQEKAAKAQKQLEQKKGPGQDFLGWLDLPSAYSTGPLSSQLKEIKAAAEILQKAEALVLVGIGGSYLGTSAVYQALAPPFITPPLPLYFAGHHLDAAYHQGLLDLLANKRYGVNVISKSGTTIEPALAFRFLWKDLEQRFSREDLKDLVFVSTDAKRGALRDFAKRHALRSFVIPDDVGGRYSVLTPVGLLPLAAAGIDIVQLLEGAAAMRSSLRSTDFGDNPALQYAAYRYSAYQAGKKIEILASYQQNLSYLAEWWKQLFGESEGKGGRGIFPAAVHLTTDLHSLGQWIQEGERSIFETVLDLENTVSPAIPVLPDNTDGLNDLAGRTLHAVNRTACQASLMAHEAGGVPCLNIRIKELSAETLGGILYFFEYACALSAYMLGVNPFDQPGVEAYKKNMFRLLARA